MMLVESFDSYSCRAEVPNKQRKRVAMDCEVNILFNMPSLQVSSGKVKVFNGTE